MTHAMTHAERVKQHARVVASMNLAPKRADRQFEACKGRKG